MGDAILTTPLIRALAKAGHQVDFVIQDAYVPLFAENPFIHACRGLRALAPEFPSRWMQLGRWCREQKYDVLILPRLKPRNLFYVSLFSGIPRRFIFTQPKWCAWGRFMLHECIPSRAFEGQRHYSDIMLDAARRLDVSPDGLKPDVFLRAEDIVAAETALRQRWGPGVPVVGIHPGNGGTSCHLSSRSYEQICQLILDKTNWRMVLTGIASEQRLLSDWSPSLLNSDRLWNVMGKFSVGQTGALIKNLDLYVCGNTGPLNLASALNVPTLTAFCTVGLISKRVWGAQSGRGEALEPAPGLCSAAEIARGKFCDFSGKISPEQFVEKAMQMLAAT